MAKGKVGIGDPIIYKGKRGKITNIRIEFDYDEKDGGVGEVDIEDKDLDIPLYSPINMPELLDPK